jgi:hypothetical protein
MEVEYAIDRWLLQQTASTMALNSNQPCYPKCRNCHWRMGCRLALERTMDIVGLFLAHLGL